VETLLGVYDKFKSIVVHTFHDHAGFNAALDKACREFMNRNCISVTSTAKGAELLARYCDSILKKSTEIQEKKEEMAIEHMIHRFLTLFKYIDDKELFQKFYSKLLARRLIYETSVSEDAEAYTISKLREICSYEYTSKLQRMFTDMGVSRELNRSFREDVGHHLEEPLFGGGRLSIDDV
jgi:cullin 1